MIRTLCFLLLGSALFSGESPRQEQLTYLANWEKTFSAAAATAGMKTAFLEFFTSEGIIFRPGPVNAQAWFRSRPEVEGLLSWEPSFVELSVNGDMGLSSGPWNYRLKPVDQPEVFGQFITIWGRQPDGRYLALLDAGTVNLPPEAPPALTFGPGSNGPLPPMTATEARSQLLDLDQHLSQVSINDGFDKALGPYLSDSTRILRPLIQPVIGLDAGLDQLTRDGGLYSWVVLDAKASELGDFGYTFGTYRLAGTKNQKGHYLRVWTRNRDGNWKLVLDSLMPLPT